MTFKVIRGQGQAEEMTSVPYRDYFYFIFVCKRLVRGSGKLSEFNFAKFVSILYNNQLLRTQLIKMLIQWLHHHLAYWQKTINKGTSLSSFSQTGLRIMLFLHFNNWQTTAETWLMLWVKESGLGHHNNWQDVMMYKKAVLLQRWPRDVLTKVNSYTPLKITWLGWLNSTRCHVRRCWTNIFSPKFLPCSPGSMWMTFGLQSVKMFGELFVQLVSNIFNLCSHYPPTSQTNRPHAIARPRFALCTAASRGKNSTMFVG